MWFQPSPTKAFITAWVACGYFHREHFDGAHHGEEAMDCESARAQLDATGMLKKIGIPSDMLTASMPESVRHRGG